MEKSSNTAYNCAQKFLVPVSNLKSQVNDLENGYLVKCTCPELPKATDEEDTFIDKFMKTLTENKWKILGAGAGLAALPALGFGAIGPVAGSFAACEKNLKFRAR